MALTDVRVVQQPVDGRGRHLELRRLGAYSESQVDHIDQAWPSSCVLHRTAPVPMPVVGTVVGSQPSWASSRPGSEARAWAMSASEIPTCWADERDASQHVAVVAALVAGGA